MTNAPNQPAPVHCFLDQVEAFLRTVFGPDDHVARVEIHRRPPRVVLVTDAGGHVTIGLLPDGR